MLEITEIRHYLGNIKRFITTPLLQNDIPISEATSIFGCSFSPKGWHHITETLKEYDENKNISVYETSLYKYLKYFCPLNILEVSGIEGFKSDVPIFVYPWSTSFKICEDANKDVRQSRFCGPSDDHFIEEEYSRILNLYEKIKVSGYKPWAFGNGFIGGTFLINRDGSRRFVVLQGNHRMAILAHMGMETICVRSIQGFHRVIKEYDFRNWRHVKGGMFSENEALKIFNMFFNQTGFHVKRLIEHRLIQN